VSRKIISNNNLFLGSGMGNFILSSKPYTKDIGLMQPVHNIYLLIFSEAGLVGLVFGVSFLTLILINSKNFAYTFCLCIILLIGFVDHYFITLQQGQILLTVIVVGSLKKVKKI